MIRNIVFDFGCILTGLDKQRCVEALRKVGAGRIAYYVDECKQEDLFHELEIGNSTVHEFCEEARRQCSYTDDNGVFHQSDVADEDIVWAWSELLLGVPEAKLRKILELRQSGKYRIMVLSNTNIIHWEQALGNFFSGKGVENIDPKLTVEDFFDKVYLSYEMHKVKPDACIFEEMLRDSGAKAEETLFIDDSKANCEGAKALGINVIYDPTGTEWMDKL